MADGDIIWHPEAITAGTAETLRALRDRSLIGTAHLAGGTALALAFGHGLSVDLDFFTPELFGEDALLVRVQAMPDFSLVAKGPHTLHAVMRGTKVSFLGYPYPEIFPRRQFEGVPLADPRDIACMKVSAIASSGAKRDFIDLYVTCQHFGLRNVLTWFAQKYAESRYSRPHVLKSLVFFDDAEKEPAPHMLTPIGWDEVKRFFLQEVMEDLWPETRR
jgi:hypothetical protein